MWSLRAGMVVVLALQSTGEPPKSGAPDVSSLEYVLSPNAYHSLDPEERVKRWGAGEVNGSLRVPPEMWGKFEKALRQKYYRVFWNFNYWGDYYYYTKQRFENVWWTIKMCYGLLGTIRPAIRDIKKYYRYRTIYNGYIEYEVGYITYEIIARYIVMLELYYQIVDRTERKKKILARPGLLEFSEEIKAGVENPTQYVFYVYTVVLEHSKVIIHLSNMLYQLRPGYQSHSVFASVGAFDDYEAETTTPEPTENTIADVKMEQVKEYIKKRKAKSRQKKRNQRELRQKRQKAILAAKNRGKKSTKKPVSSEESSDKDSSSEMDTSSEEESEEITQTVEGAPKVKKPKKEKGKDKTGKKKDKKKKSKGKKSKDKKSKDKKSRHKKKSKEKKKKTKTTVSEPPVASRRPITGVGGKPTPLWQPADEQYVLFTTTRPYQPFVNPFDLAYGWSIEEW